MTEAKAGKYELVAELWDEQTSAPDKPFEFTRHRKGDIVDLSASEADRLVKAGAVVEQGYRERAVYAAAKAAYEAAAALLPPDPDAGDEDVQGGLAEGAAAFPDGEPVETWTREQLDAYAGAHSVDVSAAKNKADVLALLVKPV